MVRRLSCRGVQEHHRSWDAVPANATRRSCCTLKGEPSMTWQTPAATDLRFGFEITMYVAAR
jgi:coenzyme PQQ precursor peptide PqqA